MRRSDAATIGEGLAACDRALGIFRKYDLHDQASDTQRTVARGRMLLAARSR